MNDEVEASFAELTVEILPVVRADAWVLLELLLAVGPFSQALQMDVLHGACALARSDERIPAFKFSLFLFLEADTAHLA